VRVGGRGSGPGPAPLRQDVHVPIHPVLLRFHLCRGDGSVEDRSHVLLRRSYKTVCRAVSPTLTPTLNPSLLHPAPQSGLDESLGLRQAGGYKCPGPGGVEPLDRDALRAQRAKHLEVPVGPRRGCVGLLQVPAGDHRRAEATGTGLAVVRFRPAHARAWRPTSNAQPVPSDPTTARKRPRLPRY
jgi:hypothetical protein